MTTPQSPLLPDASTSLPGYIAEELTEELDPGYGSVASEQEVSDEYLVPKSQLYVILPCIFSLTFLASMDTTILSTIMTEIASDLDAIPYLSWIATSYLLASSIIQPLGKLSDIFGRKPMILGCICVFTIGCFQCAAATTAVGFAVGRFLSGFASGLNTLGSITMSDLVPLRKRGVYQGLANLCYGTGSACGTFGGLVAKRYGWRMVFWIQCPIGIGCFLLCLFNLNLPPIVRAQLTWREKLRRVDVLGILSLALTLFVFILLTSFEFESSKWPVLLCVAFAASLASFVRIENSAVDPIVPLELLKNRSILGSSLANWFGTMYISCVLYYYPVFLSTVYGFDTGQVGNRLVPSIVLSSFSSIGSGYYMKVTGKYRNFSLVSATAGVLSLTALVLYTQPAHADRPLSIYVIMALPAVPYCAYASMLTTTLLSLIASVPQDHQSAVTSIQYAFRSTGSTLGTSVASLLFQWHLGSYMRSTLASHAPDGVSKDQVAQIITKALHNAAYIRTAPDWAVPTLIKAYNVGCWSTFLYSFVTCVLCLCALLAVREYKLHTTVSRK
ncbi:hypothetical protein OGATHE_001259 [Ogataea polymorpha]|uniref:MFS-type drug efflux transporter P55 n=1 Tax=Ogataea polymorpha TaxID=460523 RepID=A0A9P8PT08_9ASCO|nr:hypothetical protein OGATHE_001259 [Ogataea polymorpha]